MGHPSGLLNVGPPGIVGAGEDVERVRIVTELLIRSYVKTVLI